MSNLRMFLVTLIVLSSLLVPASASMPVAEPVIAPVAEQAASYQGIGAYTGTIVDEVKGNAPVPGVTVNLIGVRTQPAGVSGVSCKHATTVAEEVKVWNAAAQFVGLATVANGQYTMALVPGWYQVYSKTTNKQGMFSSTRYSMVKTFSVSSGITTTVNFNQPTECALSMTEPTVTYIVPGPFDLTPTADVTLDSGATDANGAYSIGVATWPTAPAGTQWLSARVALAPVFGVFSASASAPATAQTTTADAATFAYPPPTERAPVNFVFKIPARQRTLMEKLSSPVATVAAMSDADIRTTYQTYTATLGVKVYTQDGDGNMTRIASLADPAHATGLAIGSGKPAGAASYRNIYRSTPPDPATLINHIDAVKGYFEKLYIDDPTNDYGFMAEYAGATPLYIKNLTSSDSTWPRQLGHYYSSRAQALGKITWCAVGYDFDYCDVAFETGYNWDWNEPKLWLDRDYYSNGETLYAVTVNQYSPAEYPGDDPNHANDQVALYFNDNQVISDLKSASLPYTYYEKPALSSLHSHRYLTRIDGQMGRRLWAAFGDSTKSLRIGNMMDDYSQIIDGYDPFFNDSAWRADDFVFQNSAYPDCDQTNAGVGGSWPWGVNPYRYAYESKVCLNRTAYIAISRQDWISTGTQAIHILNKYNDPDHQYINPNYPLNGMGYYITPRDIARWFENSGMAQGGIGIKYFLKDAHYASGLRTDIFWVLETLLGYKFNDTTSRAHADTVAEQAMKRVWGVAPWSAYTAETVENGVLRRPIYQGAPMLAWKEGNSYDFGFPDPSFIQDALDMINMPREIMDIGPVSVAETTQTYLQAARVYLWYKHGQTYGNGGLTQMPRADIKVVGNNVWQSITLDTDVTGLKASDLLASLNAQGANVEAVQMWWEGETHTCATTNCPTNFQWIEWWDFPLEPGMGITFSAQYPITWRPPAGTNPNWQPTAQTYSIVNRQANMIGIPWFTSPRVGMNAAELKAGLEAACGTGLIKLYKRDLTNSNINNWVEYTGGTPWPVEPNESYAVNFDQGNQSYSACSYTP